MDMKVVLSLDLGTTGNRVAAWDKNGQIVASSYQEFTQHFPKPGWVEHDAEEIWASVHKVLVEVADKAGTENIVSMGITNQRETTVIWNKSTGKPIHNAIVWQCRRTADRCKALSDHKSAIKEKTGLFLDPYFSATKIEWLLDHVSGARSEAEKGNLLFGTIDSWILWNLTKGTVHATDPSNASRTMLFNLKTNRFDSELLSLFRVPEACLPSVKPSNSEFGMSQVLDRPIPITGILGDQQASLFGQSGGESGLLKNTYGTGLFIMAPTGSMLPKTDTLLNTVAWEIGDRIEYALEGSVFIGGSVIQWLRDGLEIIENASDTDTMARSLDSNEDVYFVPALSGLGTPHWDPNARGIIIGLTRGTERRHIVRAALESLAYQTEDVIEEIRRQVPDITFSTLRVDGGATQNPFLMQFQADISNMTVERPVITETTALGAAGMAGIASGFWTPDEFAQVRSVDKVFSPTMDDALRRTYLSKWSEAVSRSKQWI